MGGITSQTNVVDIAKEAGLGDQIDADYEYVV